MRLNKWIASQTTYSRRNADELITAGRVTINGRTANLGDQVTDSEHIQIDAKLVRVKNLPIVTLLLNKPDGYVCSRRGQGAPTVYSLLPLKYHHLEIAGRLDKDSTGLVLLTSDRELVNTLTHPSGGKTKTYAVTLDNALSEGYRHTIEREGITLDDGISQFEVAIASDDRKQVLVTMHEGRNRQIRRTFDRMGNRVTALERIQIANHKLGELKSGEYRLA
jgi:23S rRNA pseudouridine2605 synthase